MTDTSTGKKSTLMRPAGWLRFAPSRVNAMLGILRVLLSCHGTGPWTTPTCNYPVFQGYSAGLRTSEAFLAETSLTIKAFVFKWGSQQNSRRPYGTCLIGLNYLSFSYPDSQKCLLFVLEGSLTALASLGKPRSPARIPTLQWQRKTTNFKTEKKKSVGTHLRRCEFRSLVGRAAFAENSSPAPDTPHKATSLRDLTWLPVRLVFLGFYRHDTRSSVCLASA